MSAECLLGRLRRREHEFPHPAGGRTHWKRSEVRTRTKKAKAGQQVPRQGGKRRKGGGGPWRAFVSSRCRGVCRADFGSLSGEYGQLSDDDKVRFADMGVAATLGHSAGGRAFGLSGRALARALVRQRVSQLARLEPQELSASLTRGAVVSIASVPSSQLDTVLKQGKVGAKLMRAIAKRQDETAAEGLVAWRSKQGATEGSLRHAIAEDCSICASHDRGATASTLALPPPLA